MHEVAPGIWLDDTTGQYYDDQGNPISGAALNAALSGSSDTSGGAGTGTGDVTMPPGVLDPDPTHAGHYPGQTPPWIAAGYPTFDAWSAAVGAQKAADEAYRQGQIALQQKQINATAGAGSATLGAASISAQAQRDIEAQRAQNALDVQRLQNEVANAKTAADREIAANALNEKYAELALSQKQEGFNEFTKLSDIASNPRNFMQTFFLHRGFQPPADVSGYGNGLNGLGAGHIGSGTQTATGAGSTPHPMDIGTPDTVTPQERVYNAIHATPTPGDLAPYVAPGGGNVTATDPRTSGGSVTTTPTNQATMGAQDALIAQGRVPRFFNDGVAVFAKGGVVPEPVMGVGAHSNPAMFHALSQMPGHKYLMGERGPEGVVPAHYLPKFLQSRAGKQALPQHAPMAGNLASSDTQYGTSNGGMTSTYGDGGMVGAPQGASGGDLMAMFGNGGPLGIPTQAMQAAMRTPLYGRTMDGGAMGVAGDITAFADGGTLGTDIMANNPAPDGFHWDTTTGRLTQNANYSTILPSTPASTSPSPSYTAPTTGTPISNTAAAPATQSAPAAASPAPATPAPGTATQGNPYNTTATYSGAVSPYQQLVNANAVPPFLSRVMAQAQGNQEYGTNLPQMAYLPPNVPLVSKLAYDQMSPSEQEALQSYVSSYGIDPNDYLAQMADQVAPARRRQNISYNGQ